MFRFATLARLIDPRHQNKIIIFFVLYHNSNTNTNTNTTSPNLICLNDQATYQVGYDPESAVSTERPAILILEALP